jgi:glycosyltransferase involved in cell wall biosynthesis
VKPTKKIKISIVLPNLAAGGAERVLSFIAQELNPNRFKTTLVIIGHEKDAAYDIEGIEVIFFNKDRVMAGIKDLFQYIRHNKPNIVVSAVGHLNTVTAYMKYLFPRIKFVAREVNVLSVLNKYASGKTGGKLYGLLARHRFNRFHKIICQSQDMLNDLNSSYSIKQHKLVVINNPVTFGFELKQKNTISQPIRFITVARLVRQKGHARLIEILGKLDFPFHYTIIGDGMENKKLFKRIEELGFSSSVTNIPFTKEVAKYLKESDLYLQGSYVEGFPNAVIESCMVGTPVLAIDAPGGINEIILEGINGHIASDEAEFLRYLNEINTNYIFNPKRVSETISSRYSPDIILKKYETLFEGLVN